LLDRKNHNSVLVLATLGVYLGLVLVGATPQVLAQAAMTRQFDVKDEIEVKDDLDKKPDGAELPVVGTRSEAERKVTNSVRRFLAQFQPVHRGLTPADVSAHFVLHEARLPVATVLSGSHYRGPEIRTEQFLTITNLPRAGLDTLLAPDAK
jgi:hypothetical protein